MYKTFFIALIQCMSCSSFLDLTLIEGMRGKKPQVTFDKLLDSPSKLPFICLQKENLTLLRESLSALFHAALQFTLGAKLTFTVVASGESCCCCC